MKKNLSSGFPKTFGAKFSDLHANFVHFSVFFRGYKLSLKSEKNHKIAKVSTSKMYKIAAGHWAIHGICHTVTIWLNDC